MYYLFTHLIDCFSPGGQLEKVPGGAEWKLKQALFPISLQGKDLQLRALSWLHCQALCIVLTKALSMWTFQETALGLFSNLAWELAL